MAYPNRSLILCRPERKNLPREYKAFFGAPPGKCLLSVDYGQIEFRLAVWVAGVMSVMKLYDEDPNFDVHAWMAPKLGTTRQIAKSANFGLLYKSSAEGLRVYCQKNGITISTRESLGISLDWVEAMPEIKEWWLSTEAFVRKHGYVETMTGRRRHFGDPAMLPKGAAWNEMVRQAVNMEIQSLAFDVAATGLALCHQAGYPVNGFIHDSIMFEFDSVEEANAAEACIRDILTVKAVDYLEEHFGFRITVPLTVEFTYTKGEPIV